SSVTGMASSFTQSFATVRDEMALQKSLAAGMGRTYDGLGPSFNEAGTQAVGFRDKAAMLGTTLGNSAKTGLRGAASSLLGLMGGPWGLALTGATIAVSLWAKEQAEAKSRIQEITSSLNEQTGALTENSREVIAKQ